MQPIQVEGNMLSTFSEIQLIAVPLENTSITKVPPQVNFVYLYPFVNLLFSSPILSLTLLFPSLFLSCYKMMSTLFCPRIFLEFMNSCGRASYSLA